MTPRNLFTLILKVLGIILLKDVLAMLPNLITITLYFGDGSSFLESLYTLTHAVLGISFLSFVAYYLIFKSQVIIDSFTLDKGFSQEIFSFDLSQETVIRMAVIFVSAFILISEIPNLITALYQYYIRKNNADVYYADFSDCLYSGMKIVISFLVIGERRRIVDFILSRADKPQAEDENK